MTVSFDQFYMESTHAYKFQIMYPQKGPTGTRSGHKWDKNII